MSTYAIGDVQGCFTALQNLLTKIQFDATQDCLWFTGDLVNRGTQSLQVLRFVQALGERHKVVLGNHDLHLLAVAHGVRAMNKHDTLTDILTASDKQTLLEWLRYRPLLHYDANHDFVMTHAGLAPSWTLQTAQQLAHEVENVLQGAQSLHFLKYMYGNEPDNWHDNLSGIARLRCITNYFTRMRFCYADGRLNFTYSGTINDKPADLLPWFAVKNRMNAQEKIIFGHWAALNGQTGVANLFPLDTGCIWGNCLTAFRLEDRQRFSVQC